MILHKTSYQLFISKIAFQGRLPHLHLIWGVTFYNSLLSLCLTVTNLFHLCLAYPTFQLFPPSPALFYSSNNHFIFTLFFMHLVNSKLWTFTLVPWNTLDLLGSCERALNILFVSEGRKASRVQPVGEAAERWILEAADTCKLQTEIRALIHANTFSCWPLHIFLFIM